MGSSLPDKLMDDSVFHVATLGMYAGTAEANRARRNAEKQARRALSDEEYKQWMIDENIRKVRSMFGVDPWEIGERPGDFSEMAPPETEEFTRRVYDRRGLDRTGTTTTGTRPNPAYREWAKRRDAHADTVADWERKNQGNAAARESKSKLDRWLDDYSGAVVEANTQDLNDQFTASTTGNRWALADRGLLGGSDDAGLQRQALSELIAGRQKVVAAGRDARRMGQMQLTNQRLNLEQQVAAGTQLNPDLTANMQQVQMGLDTARSQIVPNAVGNAFTTIGQTAGQVIANGGGRQTRMPAASSANSSSTGTITTS